MIILQVYQDLENDGYQDSETGAEYYDPNVYTPYGKLGKVVVTDGKITQSDGVVLLSKALADVSGSVSDLGLRTFRVEADNGYALYQIHEDDLEWSDKGPEENCYLATLNYVDLKDDYAD